MKQHQQLKEIRAKLAAAHKLIQEASSLAVEIEQKADGFDFKIAIEECLDKVLESLNNCEVELKNRGVK